MLLQYLLQKMFLPYFEFSTAVTLVFSVTWSSRNHSNILICCSRNL